MSAHFGTWNFDGQSVDRRYLGKVRTLLASYGPDGQRTYEKDGMAILYSAFHTTKESRHQTQPYLSASGRVFAWDGRLDNREALLRALGQTENQALSDVEIVTMAYQQWGQNCFGKLIGDWALAIWDPRQQTLLLAKDFLGTRPLYYSLDPKGVTWSSVLGALIVCSTKSVVIDREYLAGWLTFFPASNVTPYVGIRSVPPCSFVSVTSAKNRTVKYWDFDPHKKIRYRSDFEYEEHFRAVFAQSVARRLHADAPVLAELSGGLDSSSIVCMADTCMATGHSEAPRLDTLSCYDDSEPHWNERLYFEQVEAQRGRTGCHIDVSSRGTRHRELETGHFLASPGDVHHWMPTAKRRKDCIESQGNRVLLSGIGGDEVTGGVPTPTPELADLLSTARFGKLATKGKAWALANRKPWLHLLFATAREFLPYSVIGVPEHRRPPDWLCPTFAKDNRAVLAGYPIRTKFFDALPSFQACLNTLETLRRQLGCVSPTSNPPCEKRYPFLDRDLLEFLYTVPREQLVRPGERRSLMRRALVGIVPKAILERKRKAFVARAPLLELSTDWSALLNGNQEIVSASLGVVDPRRFQTALQDASSGRRAPLVPLLRMFSLELWLRALRDQGILQQSELAFRPSLSSRIRTSQTACSAQSSTS